MFIIIITYIPKKKLFSGKSKIYSSMMLKHFVTIALRGKGEGGSPGNFFRFIHISSML